jgi:lipoprotein-anchoring transpeptidase ErfK/SrfK
MRQFWILIITLTLITTGVAAQPAQASGGIFYLVQAGDTLYSIAAAHGLSVDELADANGLAWNAWLYPGQQMFIPGRDVGWTNQFNQPFAQLGYGAPRPANYNPQPYAYPAFQNFNSAPWPGVSFNQPPSVFYQPAAPYSSGLPAWSRPPAPAPAFAEKWIDVNLTNQTVIAYEGQIPVFRALASTGIWKYPTIAGTFNIYVKYEKTRMTGGSGVDAYDLLDVPYVMYFHGGYGLHGTYWHNNFGTPMSHGCVNLSIRDAEWLFNWAPLGTRVVSHY